MSKNIQNFILFYSSKQSEPCNEFIRELYKNIDLYKKFIKVDVMSTSVKIPSYIKEVPSIVIQTEKGSVLHTGDKAFEWLMNNSTQVKGQGQGQGQGQGKGQGQGQGQGQGKVENGGIQEYDPFGMSGFSDGFSYIGTDNPQALDKSYEFINKNSDTKISTPTEDNLMKDDKVRGEASERLIEDLKAARERDIRPAIKRV